MGLIFDIQKFCVNDGPGIRTTVFLKGCPLRCLWCHNPESQSSSPQLAFDSKKCTGCKRCEKACGQGVHSFSGDKHIIDYKRCRLSKECVKSCPTGALSIFGREASVSEIMEAVVKDKAYYDNSGGGLTISGGEPMAQFSFTLELAKEAKKHGIHVAIETSGYGRSEDFEEILNYVDLFLFDYKATGDELHKKLTGVDRRLIEKNFNLLLEKSAKIILRCPIIPNNNLSEEHLAKIAEIGNSSDSILGVEILPYHNFGIGKEKQIGLTTGLKGAYVPDDKEVEGWLQRLREYGLDKVYRG